MGVCLGGFALGAQGVDDRWGVKLFSCKSFCWSATVAEPFCVRAVLPFRSVEVGRAFWVSFFAAFAVAASLGARGPLVYPPFSLVYPPFSLFE